MALKDWGKMYKTKNGAYHYDSIINSKHISIAQHEKIDRYTFKLIGKFWYVQITTGNWRTIDEQNFLSKSKAKAMKYAKFLMRKH